MTLPAGTRVGPYELIGVLGAGGMGVVYRARDSRLGREVALKTLTAEFKADPERLKRFELEARATSSLNHPNIVAMFDVGEHEGVPYVVTELLEGQTLRETGAVPLRKALDYARQLAHGLSAAHEKGIVHRDLKPENLFITRDGRLKILDFGLAKLAETRGAEHTLDQTAEGAVLGTAGYMSPEQVRGRPADMRSDIFSLGAVLYELLSGRRAFEGNTAVERGHAILNVDPPGLQTPSAVERVTRRCLEKSPEQRFQSARDVAFALEAISEPSSPLAIPIAPAAGMKWALVAFALVLGGGFFALGRQTAPQSSGNLPVQRTPPNWQPLTFRRGFVREARFAPDEKTVIFSAAWEGALPQVFSTIPGNPEARALTEPGFELAAVSKSGELAILAWRPASDTWGEGGKLSRMHLGGGVPRVVAEEVAAADFLPSGELAVVRVWRAARFSSSVEVPIGTIVAECACYIDKLRVSPQGDRVAFLEHNLAFDDNGGVVVVVNLRDGSRVASSVFASIDGLAWPSKGAAVWVSGSSPTQAKPALWAVSANASRLVIETPSTLMLADLTADGRALVVSNDDQIVVNAMARGATTERELTWHGQSFLQALSRDGRLVLFNEWGNPGPHTVASWVRGVDGSPAVPLIDGLAFAFSPDGAWATNAPHPDSDRLRIVPTGAGAMRELPRGEVERVRRASFLADSVLFAGLADGGEWLYLQALDGGTPRRVMSLDPSADWSIDPDGSRVLISGPDGGTEVLSLTGGGRTGVGGLAAGDAVVGWSADSKFLFVSRREAPMLSSPVQVDRVELATGESTPWRRIGPTDRAGLFSHGKIVVALDGDAYAYSYWRRLSVLHLVDGLE